MISMTTLDEDNPYMQQLQSQAPGPITLINTFLAPKGQVEEVVAVWSRDAAYMKECKGFISTQLYGSEAGGRILTNIAVWESVQDLRNAFQNPDFQEKLSAYPDGTVAHPAVMRKLAVENICEA
ncbi:antibiotic biosynthesis monooxygenase family protein [Arthrobacter sp. SD76]|uniref:antibiotic biosynthesis monooxygenase family protein n=1 Tax=Arthrobacter sp. SD76 TaxID=3415007 RepID=UPI003C743456